MHFGGSTPPRFQFNRRTDRQATAQAAARLCASAYIRRRCALRGARRGGATGHLFVGASLDVDLGVGRLQHPHQICLHLVLDGRHSRLLPSALKSPELIEISSTGALNKYIKSFLGPAPARPGPQGHQGLARPSRDRPGGAGALLTVSLKACLGPTRISVDPMSLLRDSFVH